MTWQKVEHDLLPIVHCSLQATCKHHVKELPDTAKGRSLHVAKVHCICKQPAEELHDMAESKKELLPSGIAAQPTAAFPFQVHVLILTRERQGCAIARGAAEAMSSAGTPIPR